MKSINLNEEFSLQGWVRMFVLENGGLVCKKLRKSGVKAEFIPPTIDQVKEYFKQEGFSEPLAIKAYRHYASADWHNSKGKKVKNWKQTMSTNWMDEENRVVSSPGTQMVR